MSVVNQSAIKNWREEIRKYGKTYFEMEDMRRMGFLELSDEDWFKFRDGMKKVRSLKSDIQKINNKIGNLKNADQIIKKVRQLRIERVRKERVIKRAQKAERLKQRKEAEAKRKAKTPTYLGEGVSVGLNYEGTNEKMLYALSLPVITNVEQMAAAMELTEKQISWLSYHRVSAQTDHYNRFQIPKRKGGFRNIASPKPLLRKAQSWILEDILSKIPLEEAAMAFRTGTSIVDNAEIHGDSGVIVRIDLKDFFPTIKFNRVKGIFKSFGYSEAIATIFALICTDSARINAKLDDKNFYVALGERYLPQGACTSPALTNIICRRLDKRMTGASKKYGFIYTRYADDLVFSHEDKSASVSKIISHAKMIIKNEGLVMHPDKLLVMRPHQRQIVTGIVVNETNTVSRRDLRRFRSFLHHYKQHGEKVMSERIGKDAKLYAKGYWAFIHMVNPQKAATILTKNPWLMAS